MGYMEVVMNLAQRPPYSWGRAPSWLSNTRLSGNRSTSADMKTKNYLLLYGIEARLFGRAASNLVSISSSF
jgi:hypothetical protein